MDDDLAVALTGGLTDWLEALPAYQRDTINKMLEGRDPIEVSLAWLSSTGPANTEPFGAIRNAPNVFYDNLLEQLQSLLCSNKSYIKERDDLKGSIKGKHSGPPIGVLGNGEFVQDGVTFPLR